MDPTPEYFAARYAAMSEVELMELAEEYSSLTDAAQTAMRAEFARRNLEPPLIEDPVEPSEPAARELVTLHRYRDLSEAIVARSLLEAAGIAAWIRDENLVRMDWMYSNAVGGIRLQVDAQNVAVAEDALNQPVPESLSFGEKAEFTQPRCPMCGSLEISFMGSDRRAALTSLTLLSLPLPLGRESWECQACGACWEESDDDAPENPTEE